MKKRLFIITLSVMCAISIFAQANQQERYISGHITDAEDGGSFAGVSVFIAGTTVGTTTNSDGYYKLRIPGEGSYQITIAYVGYQSVLKDIKPGNSSVKFDAALQTKEIEMDEVIISKKIRVRQRDIDLFWRTILGKNPSRKTIHTTNTNPEAVYYYYNPETKILRVTCREPLQINNYETGYHIQYVLNDFTHDYNTEISDWNYQCIFTELEPANLKQKNDWEKKRQETYEVSLTKFIKSLYNNSLQEDGFVLANFRQNPGLSDPYRLSVINQDSILSPKLGDNSKVWNLSNEQIMLICYGRPVTENDLKVIQHTQGNDFILRYDKLPMNLLRGDVIYVYPDGTYANKLVAAPVHLSESLLGLNMRLPIEYIPETE